MLIMDRHSMMWIGVCLSIIWIVSVVNGQKTEAAIGNQRISIVTQGSKDVLVQGGENVSLTCIFSTTSRRNLTRLRWLKDPVVENLNIEKYLNANDILLYILAKNEIKIDGCNCSGTFGYNVSSLTIHNVQPNDEGDYFCHLRDRQIVEKNQPLYVYDYFNLSVEVNPDLQVLVSEVIQNTVEEGKTVAITCRSSSVYPLPEKLQILLNGTVIHTNTSLNPTSTNSDGSFSVKTTYQLRVNRTHNNTNVSCRAMVNNKPYNSTARTPLNVVWLPERPSKDDFSVQGEPGACLVEWDKFDNADNVTICHQNPDEVDMATCETFNQVQGSNHNKEIGQSIAVEKKYDVWMYISNRLGASENSTAKQCKNLSRGTSMRSSIAVMAGAGGGALGLLFIIAVIVIVVVVRRMNRTNNYQEDPKELYADVKKTHTPQGGGRSAPPVSAPPQDVQYATVSGPQIPQKSDELQRELDGQDAYDVVHMKQPTIVPQPKLPKKDKDINGNKKTSKENPRAHQNGVGNLNAPGNHVTTPSESHTIPPSSNSHVTPPLPSTNSHVTTPPTANSRVTAPPRSQKTTPKKASHVTPPPHANEYRDTTTYARVAIQPQTPGKKPPPPQPRVENTEYFAVQFHPVPKNGIPKEDEDSD